MRKLIVCNLTSLDGYYEGLGGDVMALPMEATYDAHFLDLMRAADTLLTGATSYQEFISFWPPLADDPAAPEAQQGIAAHWRDLDKVVVSDSLTEDDVTPLGRTTIVTRADAERAVTELKQRDGRNILVFGSRTTWIPLLRAGLVDELTLLVGGAALGGGTPLFNAPVTGLRLLDHQRTGDNALLLRYNAVGASISGWAPRVAARSPRASAAMPSP